MYISQNYLSKHHAFHRKQDSRKIPYIVGRLSAALSQSELIDYPISTNCDRLFPRLIFGDHLYEETMSIADSTDLNCCVVLYSLFVPTNVKLADVKVLFVCRGYYPSLALVD